MMSSIPPIDGDQILVPRLVCGHLDDAGWHVCMADQRFREGAIVTLEALCGEWCYGRLVVKDREALSWTLLRGGVCPACKEHYQAAFE